MYQVLHWNLGKGSRNRSFAAQIHSVARLREFPRVAVLTRGRVWAATWNSATSSTARPGGSIAKRREKEKESERVRAREEQAKERERERERET